MTRLQKVSRILDNLGFILLFGDISNAELVKIVFWIKDQLKE